MTELSCVQCRELAPELALGVLAGRERAAALAHLERCAGCQDGVSTRAVTADRLVELLPEVSPPPGFEDRVLAAITPPTAVPAPAGTRAGPGRLWRSTLVSAMVLAVALCVGGRWVVDRMSQAGPVDSPPLIGPVVRPVAELRAAPLMSGRHQIGTAYLYSQDPSWVFVSVVEDDGPGAADGPKAGRAPTVSCQLVQQDGSRIPLGSFPVEHGHAAWATQTSVNPHTLVGAMLTSGNGDTIASADFTHPAARDDEDGEQADHGHHHKHHHKHGHHHQHKKHHRGDQHGQRDADHGDDHSGHGDNGDNHGGHGNQDHHG